MKVIFKQLSIRNFLSIGDEPVIVDFSTGLHMITGINKDRTDRRNAVGKSSILDALNFVLCGNTIRELAKEKIPNHFTKNTCEVKLAFSIIFQSDIVQEYKIIRTLEPSTCEFYINGSNETRDSITNTTNLILKTLKTTPEVFQSCILMSINSTTPFMAQKKVEKRKFIESIFNLEIFSQMLSYLKEDYQEARRVFEVASTKHEEVNNSLELLKKQQEKFALDKKQRVEKLTNRKANNNEQIKTLKGQIISSQDDEEKTLLEQKQKYEDNDKLCDTRISEVEKVINQNITILKFKREQYNKIGTSEDNCPVCLKLITSEDKSHIESEKGKIDFEIKDIEQKNTEQKLKLTDLKNLRTKLETVLQNISKSLNQISLNKQKSIEANKKIDQLEIWSKEVDVELQTLSEQTIEFKDNTQDINDRLKEIKIQFDNSKKQLHVIDTARFVISEEGVKSAIVKKMLQLFNNKIAYYLKKLDANCICVFNEYFEEEIINEKGISCSYFNFSGAERKAIDIACLFAFMDIRRLQGGVQYNISMYDELFDSSVDEKGLDLILNILKERIEKYNECILIISHRKESMKAITGEIIFLEKQNDITRRVAYSDIS